YLLHVVRGLVVDDVMCPLRCCQGPSLFGAACSDNGHSCVSCYLYCGDTDTAACAVDKYCLACQCMRPVEKGVIRSRIRYTYSRSLGKRYMSGKPVYLRFHTERFFSICTAERSGNIYPFAG